MGGEGGSSSSRAVERLGGEQRRGDGVRAGPRSRMPAGWAWGKMRGCEEKIAQVTGSSGTCAEGSPTLFSSVGLKRIRRDYSELTECYFIYL